MDGMGEVVEGESEGGVREKGEGSRVYVAFLMNRF